MRHLQAVECLGDERWVVVMVESHDDPAGRRAALPERRRASHGRWCAMFERQPEPQPAGCDPTVLGLGAALGGLGSDSGRAVDEDHCRLDLIAVLAARAAATGSGFITGSEQRSSGEGGGMHGRAFE